MKFAITPALKKRLDKGWEVSVRDIVDAGQASLDNWEPEEEDEP